ncbi:MAG: hypothetical protein AB1611_14840 [bacterium]
MVSYLVISSDYNWAHGDAGVYARSARILYETNTIDVSYSASSLVGQLLFSNILCHLFGFRLKVLHLSVYLVNFLALAALYLLLSELGLNRFSAVCGSLTMLINPIWLKMIDWYMTEPFFMFYLIASILFFIKGLRRNRPLFLYLGSTFAALAVLTRQHAVSLSIALMAVCLIYRKSLKKETLIHSLAASAIPLISIGLFYLCLFGGKIIHSSVSYSTSVSSNLAIIKSLTNPLTLLSRLYFDTLFSLHYSAVYLAPLFITFALALVMNPRRGEELHLDFSRALISVLAVSAGTMILYLKNNRPMPYLPSIFSIGALTRIFNVPVLSPDTASFLLTGLSWAGAVILLTGMLEYFVHRKEDKKPAEKVHRKGMQGKNIKPPDEQGQDDPGLRFFYLWGIAYLLVAIMIGLQYDRYIFPVSILMIYLLLSRFPWIGEQKKTLVVALALIYSLVIFQVASHRLSLDLEWTAGETLVHEGVPPCAINGGLGFNHFYSFDCITEAYKNVTVGRPINWYKFHPMAEFFVTGDESLADKQPGLRLYRTFTRERLFGLLEGTSYIYHRKDGFREPVWI